MSPEGIFHNCYGEKTDIWAFGVLIYELLHGITPFDHCKTKQDLKKWVIQPLADNRFKHDIPVGLKQLIRNLMEIDETKRPNIQQVADQPYMKQLMARLNP